MIVMIVIVVVMVAVMVVSVACWKMGLSLLLVG